MEMSKTADRADGVRSVSLDAEEDDVTVGPSDPSTKKSWLSRCAAAATNRIDDYKTRKAGHGPPYYTEYGGDLPGDCNRMSADLAEIDELLRNGANPNIGHVEDHGLTPVHFAARFGNVELLKMLKRAAADPNITNALGLTPLSYCCAFKLSMSTTGGDPWEGKQVSAIAWLLENGANPDHVDKAGYTPLAWACRSGVLPAAITLVEAGADVMQRRPMLPGGSEVQLPKVDILAVTANKQIRRYIEATINTILRREAALLLRDVKADRSKARLEAVQAAIARRQEARDFVKHEKERARQQQELTFELMQIDKAEEARRARRHMLRCLKISPGIWKKTRGIHRSPQSPNLTTSACRPRWFFDTDGVVTNTEAAAHDVLEQARQVEASIIRGDHKQELLKSRWRSLTGKRLLPLKQRRRSGFGDKGARVNGASRREAKVNEGASPLRELKDENTDDSSSSWSDGSNREGS